jgi:hypothetical protein
MKTIFLQAFRVYPNPASTDVVVEFPAKQENIKIAVFDQQQKLFSEKLYSNERSIKVLLPPTSAIYYLIIDNISSAKVQ